MSKRSRDDDGSASSQMRGASARPDGRVSIDVGATRFVSSKSTLASSSLYFRALLDRWDEHGDEQPLFVDADADAFQILLSCMRAGSAILPEHDAGLFARVIFLAEYLQMDALLAEIKARAYANMHPDSNNQQNRKNEECATLFDRETGGLQAAIASKVLPSRFFQPAPEEPPPPARTIKASFPAPPGYRAFFSSKFTIGDYFEIDEDNGEFLDVISFVLVEFADGTQQMDAYVQKIAGPSPGLQKIAGPSPGLSQPEADEHTRSHIQLASTYADPDMHWVLRPPVTPLVAIPPGTVRGVWRKPALTPLDVGKTLTIEGRHKDVKVDGSSRGQFQWEEEPPADITDIVIEAVRPWGTEPTEVEVDGDEDVEVGGGTVLLANGTTFKLPAELGTSNVLEIDLAFAQFAEEPTSDGKVYTTFYMPIAHAQTEISENAQHRLVDARQVTFGDKRFSHFTGAKRN